MLPVPHRIRKSQDFQAVMRAGARAGTETVVVAVRAVPADHAGEPAPPWRAGFIVSKAVGNAVARHRTARRLRHLCAELLPPRQVEGHRIDVVVRALPPIIEADHQKLAKDLRSGLKRALRRAGHGETP
ncbi:ribonuclease P protein component [Nesterenkonia populi]|uniref:ribonuclease P protein component n=1 Tax=Nesterenkonia populi TaxID=1591087 RepID=UPI0011BE2840|nr:ribonuclease P protein component [Nesterenkonia populi]